MEKLVIVSVKELNKLDETYKYLDEERINKANNFKLLNDKKLSILAGLLIKAYTSNDIIKYTQNDKPYKDSLPYFNISHSNQYAIIYTSNNKEIGVDIEEIKPHKVSKYLFNDNLYHSDIDIIKMWTLKEAIIKALGLTILKSNEKIELTNNIAYFLNNSFYFKQIHFNNYIITLVNKTNSFPELEELSLKELIRVIEKK